MKKVAQFSGGGGGGGLRHIFLSADSIRRIESALLNKIVVCVFEKEYHKMYIDPVDWFGFISV